jgi:hypothetical protein
MKSPENRTCVQCKNPDGQAVLHRSHGVWLHRECFRFYLKAHHNRRGLS